MSRDRMPKLGRGLASLLGERPEASDRASIQAVAVHLIDANRHQPRGTIDPATLTELVASIRAQGILQPLLLRQSPDSEGRFEIIAGERRWRAAIQAGLSDVPCVVRNLDDHQSAAAAMVENLQRLDLNAIEEAEGFLRLTTQFGATQEELAEAVGKSRSHIANTVRLLRLPQAVQLMVRDGTLSAGHARTLLLHSDPVTVANRIIEKCLSVRQAEALVDRSTGRTSPDASKVPEVNADAVEKDLADHLGLSVSLRENNGRGSLTLRFSRLDQLDQLVATLRGASFGSRLSDRAM